MKLWKGKNQRKREEKEREKRERKKKKKGWGKLDYWRETESEKERKGEGVLVYQIRSWGPWGGEQVTSVSAWGESSDAGCVSGEGLVLYCCRVAVLVNRTDARWGFFVWFFYCFLFWILDEICDLGWVQLELDWIGVLDWNWIFSISLFRRKWCKLHVWRKSLHDRDDDLYIQTWENDPSHGSCLDLLMQRSVALISTNLV